MITHNIVDSVVSYTAAYTIPDSDMAWVLTIVGLVVVMAAQSLLAIILTQFKWLDPEWRRLRKMNSSGVVNTSVKPKAEPVKVDHEAAKAEEELAAVAVAVMLYLQDETSYVNCTEILENEVAPWTERKNRTVFSAHWH